MGNSIYQKAIACAVLIAAVAMLIAGGVRAHKVYDQDDEFAGFGMVTFNKISDIQLVIDATFTGVVRRDGTLYSTYDRSQPRGKKACPT